MGFQGKDEGFYWFSKQLQAFSDVFLCPETIDWLQNLSVKFPFKNSIHTS